MKNIKQLRADFLTKERLENKEKEVKLKKKDSETIDKAVKKMMIPKKVSEIEKYLIQNGKYTCKIKLKKEVSNTQSLAEFISFWNQKGVDIKFSQYEYNIRPLSPKPLFYNSLDIGDKVDSKYKTFLMFSC